MEAIQSRNTVWQIKFNGQQFMATLPNGETMNANYRDWGSSSWFQNDRLQYGAFLSSGDFDLFEPVLEFYLNTLPFAQQRTQLYFNHTGIFYTETKTIWGAYSPQDYGCTRPTNYPVWLETNDYIHFDYGGDGGTPEVALFALDYLLYTNDTSKFLRYLPLVLSTADFFRQHYTNRSSNGDIVIYPTQILETYWCTWDTTINGPTNCCENDLPTVAGLHTLVEKMLALPTGILTPQQITEIEQFQAILPPLPMENGMLVGAEVISSGVHNSEFVTGYAMHPYRRYTVGRNLTQNLDLDPALRAFAADPRAMDNEGWNQGIMDAAFLGLTEIASRMLIERATGPTAPGYRYLSFTPHYQDYEPSANHLANFVTGLNLMLLQPVDDGYNGTFVIFPAWPCEWDVSFQLWGGLNTTVTIDYSNGNLNSFVVNPPERKNYFTFANCVKN